MAFEQSISYAGFSKVKTRLQLEQGKASAGLFGTFRNIIKQEGYVVVYFTLRCLNLSHSFGRLYRGMDNRVQPNCS
jgi:hypothetical protein